MVVVKKKIISRNYSVMFMVFRENSRRSFVFGKCLSLKWGWPLQKLAVLKANGKQTENAELSQAERLILLFLMTKEGRKVQGSNFV